MTAVGGPDEPADPAAERVLSQALRAMAGGRDAPAQGGGVGGPSPWSATQVVLLALIVGLLIGMGAGIISLLV